MCAGALAWVFVSLYAVLYPSNIHNIKTGAYFLRVYTHGDFMALPHWETRLSVP